MQDVCENNIAYVYVYFMSNKYECIQSGNAIMLLHLANYALCNIVIGKATNTIPTVPTLQFQRCIFYISSVNVSRYPTNNNDNTITNVSYKIYYHSDCSITRLFG